MFVLKDQDHFILLQAQSTLLKQNNNLCLLLIVGYPTEAYTIYEITI